MGMSEYSRGTFHPVCIGTLARFCRMGDWALVLQTICEAKLEDGWEPGRRAAYHPYSSWFLLGEIVRRVDGRPFERYVRLSPSLPRAPSRNLA